MYSDPEKRKAAYRRYYNRNKGRQKAWANKRVRALRRSLDEYKAERQCKRCGFSDWRALQFHHRPDTNKLIEVSMAVGRGWSWERILTEIAKCDLICANCHQIEHQSSRRSTTGSAPAP